MKNRPLLTALIILLLAVVPATHLVAAPVQGGVAYSELPLVVVQTNLGFPAARWMGGAIPLPGEPIVGEFNTVGMKECFLPRQQRTVKLFLENFGMSKDRAEEWIARNR